MRERIFIVMAALMMSCTLGVAGLVFHLTSWMCMDWGQRAIIASVIIVGTVSSYLYITLYKK